jgi:small-conductance mechanosensitive channel
MSRDWVIDKLTVSVTYDTDLVAVKKVIKRVGAELAADPEFAPRSIETLKMQGVEQFGYFAIQIRTKMMTRHVVDQCVAAAGSMIPKSWRPKTKSCTATAVRRTPKTISETISEVGLIRLTILSMLLKIR